MGGALRSITKAVGDATKVGGSKLEMPKEWTTMVGAASKAAVDYKAVSGAMELIGQKGGAMEKSGDGLSSAIDAALKSLAKADFGLDEKSPDGKKKLDAIRKLLSTELTSVKKDVDKEMTSFSKMTDTVASAGKGSSLA